MCGSNAHCEDGLDFRGALYRMRNLRQGVYFPYPPRLVEGSASKQPYYVKPLSTKERFLYCSDVSDLTSVFFAEEMLKYFQAG